MDHEIRMQCLKLAVECVGGDAEVDVVAWAEQFYRFVTNWDVNAPREAYRGQFYGVKFE